MGRGGDGGEAPLIKEERPETPEKDEDGPGSMIDQMVGNLTAIESKMNDDVNVFKERFSELLRNAAASLRPMARVEYILPLQGVLDELRRDSLPAAAAITAGTKEALVDAQSQLGNFKKLQKAIKRIQRKAVYGAYYTWREFVDEGNAEMEAKFQQPHVKEFFQRIMHSKGKEYFELWVLAGKERHRRLEEERLAKEQAARDREGMEKAAVELAKLREGRALAVLRRILNKDLAVAFSQWKESVAVARERERLTGGVVSVMEDQLREAAERLAKLQEENEDLQKEKAELNEKLTDMSNAGDDPRIGILIKEKEMLEMEKERLTKDKDLLQYKLNKAEEAYANKPQYQTLEQSKSTRTDEEIAADQDTDGKQSSQLFDFTYDTYT